MASVKARAAQLEALRPNTQANGRIRRSLRSGLEEGASATNGRVRRDESRLSMADASLAGPPGIRGTQGRDALSEAQTGHHHASLQSRTLARLSSDRIAQRQVQPGGPSVRADSVSKREMALNGMTCLTSSSELSNGCMPDVLQGSVRPISRGGQAVSRVTRSGIGRREAKQSKNILLPHPVAESPPLDHGQAEHHASDSGRDLDRLIHFSSQHASVASIDKQALHMERPVSRR